MAPYPIKHGARAICNASQSSDWPTSRMNLLYAVHAVDLLQIRYLRQIIVNRGREKGCIPSVSGKLSKSFLVNPNDAQ